MRIFFKKYFLCNFQEVRLGYDFPSLRKKKRLGYFNLIRLCTITRGVNITDVPIFFQDLQNKLLINWICSMKIGSLQMKIEF